MITLIFASNNQHKIEEIQAMVPQQIEVVSLANAGINIDIPEPFNTLEENAATKAETIFKLTGKNCFGEDSGLLVQALNNEPGVKSARYAGEQRSTADNNLLLLKNLALKENRWAKFVTVIALHWNNTMYFFKGECEGEITQEPSGEGGFGYDPIFKPTGSTKTFGEMTTSEKAVYSHRAKATQLLLHFLHAQFATNA